jgi:hypothetical protein
MTLDRPEYLLLDQVVYEIRVQNVGATNVILPAMRALSVSAGPAIRDALATLIIRDRNGRDYRIAPFAMKGSAGVADSLLTLKPRDSATFRLRTSLYAPESERDLIASSGGDKHRVRAQLTVQVEPCVNAAPVLSQNELSLTLRSR